MITLVYFFVQVNIIIVLAGVLISEFVKRTNKQGLFLFLMLDIGILLAVLLDILRIFTEYKTIYFIGFAFLYVSLVLLFFWNCTKLWRRINKTLFYLTIVFTTLSIGFYITKFFIDISNIWDVVFMGTTYFAVYFLIIDFLIKSSGGYQKLRMKKIPSKFLAGALLVVVFALFGEIWGFDFFFKSGSKKLSSELNVYNWGEYFGSSTLEDFEKEFGVKVNLDTFEDEDVAFRTVKANPGKYDVVIAADGQVKRMLKQNMLSEINKKNVPNLKHIDKKFIDPKYDPNNAHSVPYMWGTTAFAINTKYINSDSDSWDVLWSPKYEDKIAMLENTIEVITATSKNIGLGLFPKTSSELKMVEKFLEIQKPLLQGYFSSDVVQEKLVNEELWAGQIFNGDASEAMAENSNLKYVIPKEGTSIWTDNFVIPSEAKHKYTAEVFINYILRPEVSGSISNDIRFMSCNRAARKYIQEDILNDTSVNPSENNLKKLEYVSDYDIDDQLEETINELKGELRSSQ